MSNTATILLELKEQGMRCFWPHASQNGTYGSEGQMLKYYFTQRGLEQTEFKFII